MQQQPDGKTAVSTAATTSPHPDRSGWPQRATLVALIGFAGLFVALAVWVALSRLDYPGFDFRYFWVAGQLWLDGVSPYGPQYLEASSRLIPSGIVPGIWPYPPNIWPAAVLAGFLDFHTAWILWFSLYILTIVAASALIAFGLPLGWLPFAGQRPPALSRTGFFCLHLGLIAASEAVRHSVGSGQISALIYFGVALIVVGLARGKGALVVIGLAVACMKPQIGALLIVGFLFSGKPGIRYVAGAALVTALLLVPPLIIEPAVLFDWLRMTGGYDNYAPNLPIAMTGLTNILWNLTDIEISILSAMLLSLVIAGAVALCPTLRHSDRRLPGSERLYETVMAMILIALAFAPLHVYDFTILGIAVLSVGSASRPRLLAAVMATVVLVQPSQLYLLFNDKPVLNVFYGSTFATVAALILLALFLTRPDRTGHAVGAVKR